MSTDESDELSFDRMKSSFLDKISSAKEKISSKIDDVLRDEPSANASNSSGGTEKSSFLSSSAQSSLPSKAFPSFDFGSSSPSQPSNINKSAQPVSAPPIKTPIESISERKIKYKTLFAELNQSVLLKSYIAELSDSFHEIQISAENSKNTSFAAKLDDALSLLTSSIPTVTSKSSLTITRDLFIQDAIRRSFNPSWSASAYATFCTHTSAAGGIVYHEYALAMFTLNTRLILSNFRSLGDDLIDVDSSDKLREIWTSLRRQLVFNHYDRNRAGCLYFEDFLDCVEDMSLEEGAPEVYGLEGKVWTFKPERVSVNRATAGNGSISNRLRTGSEVARDVDMDSLIQMLANNRLLLAQKQVDYDELNLKYKQLEKAVCSLKLTVAELKSQIPDRDSEAADGSFVLDDV